MISKLPQEYSIHFLKNNKTKQLKNTVKSPFLMVQMQTHIKCYVLGGERVRMKSTESRPSATKYAW